VAVRVKKLSPALKHGGYSVTGLLPGEDRVAFEKLHLDLRAEYHPDGPLEEDTVADIARLLWRKQNLERFRIADAVRKRYSAILSEMVPSTPRDDCTPPDPAELEAAREAVERARKELGEYYKFVGMWKLATPVRMLADLDVDERLNAMIDKVFKRLAMLKAFKSISSTKAPSSTELPRISGPQKAA
jgi:hypothetical protein